METSANWGFNLPNSGNDEIADINVISDNFRIIDNVMNETDQTFEPESTKAASGKAVKEAIDGIQPIDENTEFIFDGGDASGAISVDIVVDSSLSKTSTNAIQNKAVATRIDELLNAIEQAKADVLLSAYPVGSIYISVTNIDPATLFGGTWEQIKDTFLLSSGDTYTAGETGGESTHTLTVDEIPSHNHAERFCWTPSESTKNTFTVGGTAMNISSISGKTGLDRNDTTGGSTGEGKPHNNMPPYLAVYMWKRTA